MSKRSFSSASTEVPSLQELMDNLQFQNQTLRTQVQQRGKPKMEPPKPSEWSSRQTSQDIAAVEICPAHPKYMVIGTYSLVKKDEDKEDPSQFRKGELLIMTIAARFVPTYPGQLPPSFDRQEFSCAILDIHFHPSDPTLLGVATSSAQMHFYRFVQHTDVVGRQIQLKLLPLGSATIAPNDEHGLVPLITQFTWLPGIATSGKADKNDQQSVVLVATTSLNEVVMVRCTFPAIKTPFDARLAQETKPVAATTNNFPSHSLEAWTVATGIVKTDKDTSTVLVLSGGDDSVLLASLFELSPIGSPISDDENLPQLLFADKKSHTAGVTAILPLTPIKITDDPIRSPNPYKYVSPILTGSYDERIRLFTYDPKPAKKTFITELKLGGGVWRLKLMDAYVENPHSISLPDAAGGSSSGDVDATPASTTASSDEKRHFLILASCMHAGARILRLTYQPHYHSLPDSPERTELVANVGWSLEVAGKFAAGHESMVYCCDFRSEEVEPGFESAPGSESQEDTEKGKGEYTIVSTSFYDRQVCVWSFLDLVKKGLTTEGRNRS